MEGAAILRTILATLSTVQGNYPGGLPCKKVRQLHAARVHRASGALNYFGAAQIELLFVRVGATMADPWADAGGLLLKAAVEKGLGREMSSVGAVLLSDSEGLEGDLVTKIELVKPKAVVLLGEGGLRFVHCVKNIKGLLVATALDPSAVAGDPNLKRQFWAELKPLAALG